jgi:hypothetical protein
VARRCRALTLDRQVNFFSSAVGPKAVVIADIVEPPSKMA